MAYLTASRQLFKAPMLVNGWLNLSFSTFISSSGLLKLSNASSLPILCNKKLLSPPPPLMVTPSAGMKVAGKLRRRCEHCFFIMINERLHIWCDIHPRHKQMQMVSRPKTLLRVCSVSQHKIRPW